MTKIVRKKLAHENYNIHQIAEENYEVLKKLSHTPFRIIAKKLVNKELLSFEEAFLGMAFVIGATNKSFFQIIKPLIQKAHLYPSLKQDQLFGPAQTFLTLMANRAKSGLIAKEEIAGMVASAMMDIHIKIPCDSFILEIGGTGGDLGILKENRYGKVINASTLSSIVLSSLGIPVLKHGGHANTSLIGSVETIQSLGVNIYSNSLSEINRIFKETNFCYISTQVSKTIHDLTHGPFGYYETITHLIGPMTLPISKNTILNKVFGVNNIANPKIIAKAYEMLNNLGYQKIGNIAIINGLDSSTIKNVKNYSKIKKHIVFDEISPFNTLVTIVKNGRFKGQYIISPRDFGADLGEEVIIYPNRPEDIIVANKYALFSKNKYLSDYLALNSAFALFVIHYLSKKDSIKKGKINTKYLKECFTICKNAIDSKNVKKHLIKIIRSSKKRRYNIGNFRAEKIYPK